MHHAKRDTKNFPKHSIQKSKQSTDSKSTNEEVFVRFGLFCVLFGTSLKFSLGFILLMVSSSGFGSDEYYWSRY